MAKDKELRCNTNPLKDIKDLTNHALYLNRELSLLHFVIRVLAQAKDSATPLLERVRYLAICSHNLDQFFEIRVAGLKKQHMINPEKKMHDGRVAKENLRIISKLAHKIVNEQYNVLNQSILPALANDQIFFLLTKDWSSEIEKWSKALFKNNILPFLTPMGLDIAHPFPKLINKALNFIIELSGKDAFGRDSGLALINAPRILPRVFQVPTAISTKGHQFILLSTLIKQYAYLLFPGMVINGCYDFRLTRNSDLSVDEEVDDLIDALKSELFTRRYGDVVRLEINEQCPKFIYDYLLSTLNLEKDDLYLHHGPVNLSRFDSLFDIIKKSDFYFKPYLPKLPEYYDSSHSYFNLLKKEDILLHHPYESFSLIQDFLVQAVNDPDVFVIKVTLYRVSVNSKLIDALVHAGKQGKEVTAVIELKARFDEEDNIHLAERLQKAGVLVVYGILGYKIHAKMMLIIKREANKVQRYVHLGTGNYHEENANVYTDFSLLSSCPVLTLDIHYIFQQLTGMGRATKLKKVLNAPFLLHKSLLNFIKQEEVIAQQGKPARIIFKLNALTDPDIIEALYSAAQTGVKIDLLVRGLCCLRPGISNISTNIKVHSIVGRFLEHARIYYFLNDGSEQLYLSSADCMERNFFRRVEVCFPIESDDLKERVKNEGLMLPLKDNTQSWTLKKNGSYVLKQASDTQAPFCVQAALMELYQRDS